MKSVLFNTEMVRAILRQDKTATRRVMKCLLNVKECDRGGEHEFILDNFAGRKIPTGFVCRKCGLGVSPPHSRRGVGNSWIVPPYFPGDILYVRETWKQAICDPAGGGYALSDMYLYKADESIDAAGMDVEEKWHPSIHMRKEAARIFLRVKDVRVERLQNMTVDDCLKEGATVLPPPICRGEVSFPKEFECMTKEKQNDWIEATARARYIGWCDFTDKLFSTMARIWNSTVKKSDLECYGWGANPWVSVTEFERISKEEAYGNK